MIKKMQWNWESLGEGNYRAKVIGGWLIGYYDLARNGGKGTFSRIVPSVFVADGEHQWTIVQPKVEANEAKASIAKDFEPAA
jgi:hypothetical protein